MNTKLQPIWQKSQYTNLIRYVPSGTYYARIRIRGKLLRKSLNTNLISVAKLRLTDLEKAERQAGENQDAFGNGKMTFGQAADVFRQRIQGDASLKPRTKEYYEQRIVALLRSWPGLAEMELRRITKADCLGWASRIGAAVSPTAYNHTISILRGIIELGVECGARYDNPARFIKRVGERRKKLQLPDFDQFQAFLVEIENSGSGFSEPCAELVRFLAFGGFRKMEASFITWGDCDFTKGKIVVRGDPETGTKNGEFREVPMIPEMRQMLERMRSETGSRNGGNRGDACSRMPEGNGQCGATVWECSESRIMIFAICLQRAALNPAWIFRRFRRWLGHKDGGALAMRVYGHLRDQHSVNMAQRVTFSRADPINVLELKGEKAA